MTLGLIWFVAFYLTAFIFLKNAQNTLSENQRKDLRTNKISALPIFIPVVICIIFAAYFRPNSIWVVIPIVAILIVLVNIKIHRKLRLPSQYKYQYQYFVLFYLVGIIGFSLAAGRMVNYEL